VKTVAIISQKGDAGKTTIAPHLAVVAARQGLNILVIDLGLQVSAAQRSDRRAAELPVDISAHASRFAPVLGNVRQ